MQWNTIAAYPVAAVEQLSPLAGLSVISRCSGSFPPFPSSVHASPARLSVLIRSCLKAPEP